jgi:hypothetical protein
VTTGPEDKLEVSGGALKVKASANHVEESYIKFGRIDQADGSYENHIKSVTGSGASQCKITFAVCDTSATGRTNLLLLNGGDTSSTFEGRLGIGGTPSTDAKLEVHNGNLRVRGDQNAIIALSNIAGNTKSQLGNAGNEGDLSLYTSANTKTVYLSSYYDSYINPAGGKVGIGVTGPTAKLDVDGPIRSRGGTFVNGDTVTNAALLIDAEDYIYTRDSGNNYLRKLIGKTGTVINIGQTGTSLITGIDLKPGTTGGFVQVFNNGTVTAKFVDGKLGLGTDEGASKLNVLDSISLVAGSDVTGIINSDTDFIDFRAGDGVTISDTRVLRLTDANAIVTGTCTATNFILSSDETLKDNIKEIESRHIDVNWKNFELKSEPGVKRSGVIAQELEKKHPEFVRTNDEGLKSVAYIDLLISKIAELEARLEKAGI